MKANRQTKTQRRSGRLRASEDIARDSTERKRAEEAIQSLARFPSENPNSVLRIQRDGILLYANEAGAALLRGWQLEIGKPVPSVLQEAVSDTLTRQIGITLDTEHDQRIISFFVAPVVEAGYSNLYGRDVTEHKRAEDALRESERELKEAQLLGRVGNWEFDLESKKITWSDQAYRLYERDPVLGPPTAEEEAAYYSPEQAQMLHEYARRSVEEGKNFEYDLEATLPSGKRVYFSAKMQPVKDGHGRIVKLFGTVQDITERKRAEEHLAYQANLLANVSDAVTASDDRFILTAWNRAAENMFGWKSEEVLGRPGQEVFRSDFIDIDRPEVFRRVKETGQFRGEMIQYRKDGTSIHVEANAFAMQNKSGQTTGYVTISRDITERKRADAQLAEQLDELRRWHKATLGRETRILDLKREVNELLGQAGKPPRYPSAESQDEKEK